MCLSCLRCAGADGWAPPASNYDECVCERIRACTCVCVCGRFTVGEHNTQYSNLICGLGTRACACLVPNYSGFGFSSARHACSACALCKRFNTFRNFHTARHVAAAHTRTFINPKCGYIIHVLVVAALTRLKCSHARAFLLFTPYTAFGAVDIVIQAFLS